MTLTRKTLQDEVAACIEALNKPNWSIDSYRCYWEGRMALAKDLLQVCKPVKPILLHITPQTHIRSTKGDSILFRIPTDQLQPGGLLRKNRLERYNLYKEHLLEEAMDRGYSMGEEIKVLFCIPVPPSWRGKKKARFHLTAHRSKPDVDNLCKAFMDGLKPSKDHVVHTLIAKKVWVDFPAGWIRLGDWPDYLSKDIPARVLHLEKVLAEGV